MTLLIEGIDANELTAALQELPPICAQIVTFLENKRLFSGLDLVVNQGDPFLRQLEVFDSWDRDGTTPEQYQKKLQGASVLVIGAGGVGTALAELLTSVGVGTIYSVDFDRVEIHNLARQSLYTPADIGCYKVDVLAQKLNERGLSRIVPINFQVLADNVDDLLDRCGKIDVATGFPLPRSEGSRIRLSGFLKRGIPFACLGEHDVGPFLDQEADFGRFGSWLAQRFELHETWLKQRQMRARLGTHPSYAPSIATVAATTVDDIVRYITGYGPVRTRQGCFSLDPISGALKFCSEARG